MRSCWEIRQALSEARGNGQEQTDGWLMACAECGVPAGGRSCWERYPQDASGSNGYAARCCAPLHVTCDFCEIYIEHRRDIAGMLAGSAQVGTALETTTGDPAARDASSHPRGGTPVMEKVQFTVPDLWADHHSLKVREVLTKLSGVQDVVASSAFRMVAVSYDPAAVSPGAMMAALDEAGYPVATDGTGVVAHPVPVADGRKDPAWDRLGFRVARTDARDVKK